MKKLKAAKDGTLASIPVSLPSVEWIRRRSRSFVAVTVFTAVVFLRLGSFEDRIVVAAFWLSLVLLPVERIVHQLTAFMARNVLQRYVLLSCIGLIWAWASARLRGGGGPFHLQFVGIWRGYPFPFEEWWFILNPSPASERE